MNDNFNSLINKFKKINKMRYVKGINNNLLNSCGLTFENLLGKKIDSMFFPDYKDIEIKCTQRYSGFPISLFTLSFDGPSLFESNYLIEKYGTDDKDFINKKVLFANLKYKQKVLVGNSYYFELDIDYEDKKIFINIYDLNFNIIEKRAFIYFDSLNDRINVKLSNLALIFGSKKIINGDLYFRYYKIVCYKYKGFEKFLELVKSNDIKISIVLRFARSGKNIGDNKNKNMVFKIKKDKIEELFDQIYSYEN